MKYITTLLFIISIISCNDTSKDTDVSETEILLLDTNVVNEIKRSYDTTWIKEPHRPNDYWTVEYYLNKDSNIESRIMYDIHNNIVGLVRFRDNNIFYGAEYFDNGQQKGPLFTKPINEYDSVEAKYYHRNGRVRSIGMTKDGWKYVGEWKRYDSAGKLLIIENHNDSGQLLNVDTINRQ